MPANGSHRRNPAKKIVLTSTTDPSNVATTSWRMLNEISDTNAERPVTRICKGLLPSHPSAAVFRKSLTRRIKCWHSNALIDV